MHSERTLGLAYGIGGYTFWGVAPLYFYWVSFAPALEILAHRILWSMPLLVLLLAARRSVHLIAALTRTQLSWLAVSGLLIAVNWGIFIFAIVQNRVVETSLGYFINPLVSLVLGVVVLRERLRSWQWLAVAIAAAGVLFQVVFTGIVPWLGLGLAATFGLYGLVRKRVPVDPMVGLWVETSVLLPVVVGYVAWTWNDPASVSYLLQQGDPVPTLKLAAGAIVTIVPLLCFGAALNRLPLTVMSFIQYLAPTLSLLVAVLILGEPWHSHYLVTFGCIWIALVIFSLESWLVQRGR